MAFGLSGRNKWHSGRLIEVRYLGLGLILGYYV